MIGVYALIDERGLIKRIDGGVTAHLVTGEYIKFDEGEGRRYEYCQTAYLGKSVMDERGVYRYKLVDGALVERTASEMDADYADRPAPEPTTEELLLETAADHEYRICLMELGVSEDDL